MRIIGGVHRGKSIPVAKGLIVRPTTDFAKEGLFNILSHTLNFEDMNILDLFSGTGSMAMEFVSRGCANVTTVEGDYKCCRSIQEASEKLGLNLNVIKSDVFAFLENCRSPFSLIFSDPPYDMEDMNRIHRLVFDKGLLDKGGLLIVEHGPKTNLEHLDGFTQRRKYGNVHFSFFANGKDPVIPMAIGI